VSDTVGVRHQFAAALQFGEMGNRYQKEVAKRALLIASVAPSVEVFAAPHDHVEGSCVECDAHRLLLSLADVTSLHKIRRALGGHGLEPDPLASPIIACWRLSFPSSASAEEAWEAAYEEHRGVAFPVRDDPTSLDLRLGVDADTLSEIREQIADWVATFSGYVESEQLIDCRT
jgi:hypothetical protein